MCSKRVPNEKRCPSCSLHQIWCICEFFKKLPNKTPVSIVMHHRETFLTSNTARMLCRSLDNCEIVLRGLRDNPLEKQLKIKDDHQPLYLFPDDDARELTPEFLESFENNKIQLIIPDGTWSQAQKFKRREPLLKGIPSVKLAGLPQSQYGLRKQHIEGGVCTMEAGAYALGALEGDEIQDGLLEVFNNIVSRLHKSRSGNTSLYAKRINHE